MHDRMQEETISRFEYALRTERFVFFAPQAVWDAYQEGFLPNVYVGTAFEQFPGKFLKEWGWLSEKFPVPLFRDHPSWEAITKHFAIDSGRDHLIRHGDGSVSEAKIILIELRPEWLPGEYKGSYPTGRFISGTHLSPQVEHRFRVLGIGQRFDRGGGSVTSELVVQLGHYSRSRIAKLRRRLRDHTQKDPVAAVRIAKQEGFG